MLLRSLQWLWASDRACSRARTSQPVQVEAASGGRRASHQILGDRQVLHYRSTSPRFAHADAELLPAAATVQPAVSIDEKQLDRVVARNIQYDLLQSQERLRLAKVLQLQKAGITETPLSAPAQHTEDDTEVAAKETAEDAAGSSQQQPELTPELDAAASAAVEEALSGHSSTKDTAEDMTVDYTNYNILGWGNVADALGLNYGGNADAFASVPPTNMLAPADTAAAAAASTPALAVTSTAVDEWASSTPSAETSTVEAIPGNDSSETGTSEGASGAVSEETVTAPAQPAAVVVRQAKRVVPQDQIKVVQMSWAQTTDNPAPGYFYMPDPLTVPCWLEVAGGDVAVLSYDDDLADRMWEKAYEVERAAEEAAAAAANSLAAASGDGECSSAGQEGSAGTTTKVEFKFHCQTQPGERLWLIGDQPCLGGWDLQQAVKLTWTAGHIWRVNLELPVGTKAAYKAVLQLPDKQYKWQSGADHVLEVSSSSQPPQHAFK